ncbi:MAG: 16S rRNA (cytosine(1402)-N(4))-methyltransferase, partial [Sphingomonadales bacterium]
MSRSATHAALHQPVLVDEVLSILAPKSGETFVDGTFGAGGYTRAILSAADCKVYAFDRDPEAIALGRELAREFAPRLTMI